MGTASKVKAVLLFLSPHGSSVETAKRLLPLYVLSASAYPPYVSSIPFAFFLLRSFFRFSFFLFLFFSFFSFFFFTSLARSSPEREDIPAELRLLSDYRGPDRMAVQDRSRGKAEREGRSIVDSKRVCSQG